MSLYQAEVREAAAEETGLADNSVDWVVINGLLTWHRTRGWFCAKWRGF